MVATLATIPEHPAHSQTALDRLSRPDGASSAAMPDADAARQLERAKLEQAEIDDAKAESALGMMQAQLELLAQVPSIPAADVERLQSTLREIDNERKVARVETKAEIGDVERIAGVVYHLRTGPSGIGVVWARRWAALVTGWLRLYDGRGWIPKVDAEGRPLVRFIGSGDAQKKKAPKDVLPEEPWMYGIA